MTTNGRAQNSDGRNGGQARAGDQRGSGPKIDLEKLQAQAEELYLHRFVAYVRRARGEHGRFLKLRPGDESAIRAAGDGSDEYLDDAIAEDESEAT